MIRAVVVRSFLRNSRNLRFLNIGLFSMLGKFHLDYNCQLDNLFIVFRKSNLYFTIKSPSRGIYKVSLLSKGKLLYFITF